MGETHKTSFQENGSSRVTVLETNGRKPLTKRFHKGGCDQYARAKYFKHDCVPVTNFTGLVELLGELESDPHKMIVMGSVKTEFQDHEKILRRSNEKNGQPATLEDLGSHLVHFDIDELERPLGLDWKDPENLAKWTLSQTCNRLPVFKSVSAFWQASSSAGVPGKDHLAKFHFWMLADRPLKTHERKYLFETVGSDKSLALIAQPNYTASPIFDGVPDPLEGLQRSGVFMKEKDFLETSSISFPREAKKKQGKPRVSKPRQEKASLSKQSNGTGKTTEDGREILSAACSRLHQGKDAGNTDIYNESQVIGGYVASGEIAFKDALDNVLLAASKTGHERYEEAVRNGLKTGLDRPLSPNANFTATTPFYPASNLNREEAISLHSKTIDSWGRQTKAWLSNTSDGLKNNDLKSPPRILLSGAQGVGKTAALVGRNGAPGFLHETHTLVSLMLLPDHNKASEAYEDYVANSGESSLPSMVLLGRDRLDPELDDQSTKMCRAFPAAKQLAQHGISVRANLCKLCPHSKTCGYLKQEAQIARHLKAKQGLVIFAPHEFGYLPLPAEAKPDLVVFDERPRDFAVEETHVSLSELVEYLIPPSKRSRSGDDHRDVQIGDSFLEQDEAIQPIKQALLKVAGLDSHRVSMTALKASGVTSEQLDTAIEALKGFRSINVKKVVWKTLSGGSHDARPDDLSSLASKLVNLPANSARRLQFLFECLRAEMDASHEFVTSVFKCGKDHKSSHREPGLMAVRVKKLAHGSGIPFLHLDGTADPNLARIAFGRDLECHHYPVERHAHVTQVVGCNFAKRRLVEDSGNWSRLSGKQKTENRALKKYVEDVLERYPGAAFFSNKSIVSSLSVPDATRMGHFGALRGQNRWEDRDSVIIIGREQPSPRDVEARARAYAAAAGDAFISDDFKQVSRGIRLKDGVKSIEVYVHPDPWGDRILRQIREAEIEQAIDRIRLIHNPKRKSVYLLSPVVIDVTVDAISKWGDFKKGGTRIERAILEHGLVFLSPSDCARYMPQIWKSKQLASLDIRHAKAMSKEPFRFNLHGEIDEERPLHVAFSLKLENGSSSKLREALVFADISEATAYLEKLTGPIHSLTVN
ncbi:hypothetical protein [Shimia thalassica]|uniref:hypothetical protein n=1 Tax=Shimia thalassica TaxID=1715693 RepID=UPI0026E28DBB|nr:hypothetical protein [Shimia thalassica]MDO6481414.1 hypothetical protein [Shimia thalassica]